MDESKETAVSRKEFSAKTTGSRSGLGVPISPQQITRYLESVKEKGRAAGSLQKYHRGLTALYDCLPPGKRVGPDTLREWREELLRKGYATRAVNACIGITVQELPELTVEALSRGYLAIPSRGGRQMLMEQTYNRMLETEQLIAGWEGDEQP